VDFAKQYIIQCIIAAANNLRLSSEKIETIAIIRERLNDSKDLLEEIKNFKKVTELSKLGIKLHEVYNFIDNGKIDFSKLSDKFKEHVFSLVKELNTSLDILTPHSIREIFNRISPNETKEVVSEIQIKGTSTPLDEAIEIPKRSRADEIKEEIIFEDLEKENPFNFENYEEKIY